MAKIMQKRDTFICFLLSLSWEFIAVLRNNNNEDDI